MMAPFDAVFGGLNLGEIVVPVNPEADSIAHRHPARLRRVVSVRFHFLSPLVIGALSPHRDR
jgi:hypothetical protein